MHSKDADKGVCSVNIHGKLDQQVSVSGVGAHCQNNRHTPVLFNCATHTPSRLNMVFRISWIDNLAHYHLVMC